MHAHVHPSRQPASHPSIHPSSQTDSQPLTHARAIVSWMLVCRRFDLHGHPPGCWVLPQAATLAQGMKNAFSPTHQHCTHTFTCTLTIGGGCGDVRSRRHRRHHQRSQERRRPARVFWSALEIVSATARVLQWIRMPFCSGCNQRYFVHTYTECSRCGRYISTENSKIL